MYPSVSDALEQSLLEHPEAARDVAAVALARTYARLVEAGTDVDKFGPQYLAVLNALGLTPASRASLVKGQPGHGPGERPPVDDLERIRRGRAERAAGTR